MSMIPENFEQWRDCIENRCKIALTADFADSRLLVYNDPSHPETVRFIKQYGKAHLENVRSWFSRIAQDI